MTSQGNEVRRNENYSGIVAPKGLRSPVKQCLTLVLLKVQCRYAAAKLATVFDSDSLVLGTIHLLHVEVGRIVRATLRAIQRMITRAIVLVICEILYLKRHG